MLSPKVRTALSKINKTIEEIFDHSTGRLQLYISEVPVNDCFVIDLDNLKGEDKGIIMNDVCFLSFDDYSFEEFVQIIAEIVDHWKFVTLAHGFSKEKEQYIRNHVHGTVREDIVMW